MKTRHEVGETMRHAIRAGNHLSTNYSTGCVGEIVELAKHEMTEDFSDQVNAVLDMRLARARDEIRQEILDNCQGSAVRIQADTMEYVQREISNLCNVTQEHERDTGKANEERIKQVKAEVMTEVLAILAKMPMGASAVATQVKAAPQSVALSTVWVNASEHERLQTEYSRVKALADKRGNNLITLRNHMTDMRVNIIHGNNGALSVHGWANTPTVQIWLNRCKELTGQ